MTLKRAVGIAAGAGAGAALLFWAMVAGPLRRRRAPTGPGPKAAPSAWGGAAVLR